MPASTSATVLWSAPRSSVTLWSPSGVRSDRVEDHERVEARHPERCPPEGRPEARAAEAEVPWPRPAHAGREEDRRAAQDQPLQKREHDDQPGRRLLDVGPEGRGDDPRDHRDDQRDRESREEPDGREPRRPARWRARRPPAARAGPAAGRRAGRRRSPGTRSSGPDYGRELVQRRDLGHARPVGQDAVPVEQRDPDAGRPRPLDVAIRRIADMERLRGLAPR